MPGIYSSERIRVESNSGDSRMRAKSNFVTSDLSIMPAVASVHSAQCGVESVDVVQNIKMVSAQ